MYLSQRHLLLVFVSNLLKASDIICCLHKIGLGIGVGVAGLGIKVQNFMAGDNFAHANGGHCYTFGDISDRVLQVYLGVSCSY